MTCNGDLDHWSPQLFSSALPLLAGYAVPSSLLMARYDPVKECAQDRTGYVSRLHRPTRSAAQRTARYSQRISGNGPTACFGDADITYPVASRNSPPVDEGCVALRSKSFSSSIELSRSWQTGHQAGGSLNSNPSGYFDATSSMLPGNRGHHHRSYAPYPNLSTYGSNMFKSTMRLLRCMDSQQFDHRPLPFPLRGSSREVFHAEVGPVMSLLS
jgi:hypothetical protein